MSPVFIWVLWTIVYPRQPMPLPLMLGPFIVCFPLYRFLIQWGRRDVSSAVEKTPKPAVVPMEAETETIAAALTLPTLQSNPPLLTRDEEDTLRNCFPWTVYYIQSIEYRSQIILCWGHLRSTSEVAYQTIRENVQKYFGERFLVVFQEGPHGKPFFTLFPNPQAQQTEKQRAEPITRPVLALGLLVTAVFTATIVGVQIMGVSEQDLQTRPVLWLTGLPYAISFVAILGIHELGHYLTARAYQMQTALPYIIPEPFFFGALGAVTQIRSPMPNRKALFDVSIAGPIAGFLITVPLLLWGLSHSTPVPLPPKPELFNFRAFNPSSYLLLLLLSKLALGKALTAETALRLHPVAIAGFLGMFLTAINLTPVGRLDGGHIVHAMFGQRASILIGQVSRFLLLALSVVQQILMPWAILLFFMPLMGQPALNDVSELDNRRDLWGLLTIGILLLIILPAPSALTRLLL